MNFSSSNKKLLNGSGFFLVCFSVVMSAAGCSGAGSFSGGRATPTPVSDGIKSGGGNLGSRYGAEILV